MKLAVIATLALILSSPATASWPNGFSYRRTVAVDATKVSNTDQLNFPLLVKVVDTTFTNTANGGHVSSLSGYDIVFSRDSQGSIPLAWEIEFYDAAAGTFWAWVNLPVLSHTSTTVFYVFYGNNAVTNFQSTPAAVWDLNFKAVYHLSGSTPALGIDSTGMSNLSVNRGTPLSGSGKVAGAIVLNGASSMVADSGTVINSSRMTIEAWINTLGTGYSGVASRDDYNSNRVFQFRVNTANHIEYIPFPGGGPVVFSGSKIVNDGIWHSVAATYDGSTMAIYVDGQLDNSTPATGALNDVNQPLYVGYINSGDGPFAGSIDEVRYSTLARSSDWIATSYNNQSNPESFSALGSEQTTGKGQTTFIIL